jgi:hypothetical protein
MRKISKVVVVLGVAVLLAVPALAQQRQQGQQGRGGGGFGGGLIAGLIENVGVQQELKLDNEQVEKAKAAVDKVREKHSADRAKLQDLSREERRDKSRAINQAVSEETMTALADVLKPEQIKRFKQIELQRRGGEAFTEPEVQKALKLTGEQKERIKTIAADAAQERRELFQGAANQGQGGANRGGEEAQKKMATLRKATVEKVSAVLTVDQKQTWKGMIGQPFEVQFQGGRNR